MGEVVIAASNALVPRVADRAVEAFPGSDAEMQRVRATRDLIPTADARSLIDLSIYADAICAAARAKDATDLVREAAETRLLADRRIGEIILDNEGMWDGTGLESAPLHCTSLAEVPRHIFNRALTELLPRDKATGSRQGAARSVMAHARLLSLRPVEKDIWIAYDGSYYSKRSDGRWTARIASSIEQAREWVVVWQPMRKKNAHFVRLDKSFSSARFLSDGLRQLGPSFKGEARAHIAEAELLAMKVAELLDKARRTGL